ncbi:MAG: undecaprenyldiphospho-muramoylpentapeptide beta-N-acetylglucosaminyltransferase [Patescibacteria group bacterium]|nr:undecaprenyldiphospho-muramoylpentapeptide beta-N-acetylglucosaminyltransferase [Patescibacteria group bacterium]
MDKDYKKVVIALTGGGTAGHVVPTITVGKKLKQVNKNLKIIYLGSRNGLEEKMAQELGFKFFNISAGKWRRYFSLANLLTPYMIWKGVRQAKKILQTQEVKVIFAKGGYVSFPVILAASKLNIPVIGHESDSVIGKTNLMLLKHMKALAVAFPRSLYPKKLKEKLVYTGVPISEVFLKKKKDWPRDLKLKNNLPVLVVTGGSQGAQFLNNFIFRNLKTLLPICQVIHLTGEQGVAEAKKIKKAYKIKSIKNYHFNAFSDHMPAILEHADLILSRAGANTLFELAATKKAAILIPLPQAAQDHQMANAHFAARLGGAVVFNQKKFNEGKLLSTIRHFLNHPEICEDLGRKLHGLYVVDSTDRIVDLILEQLENN